MKRTLRALTLVLAGCCGGPANDAHIAVEIGARTKDLEQWDTTSDEIKKAQAEESLQFVKDLKERLGN